MSRLKNNLYKFRIDKEVNDCKIIKLHYCDILAKNVKQKGIRGV